MRLFISHSSIDKLDAEEISRRVREILREKERAPVRVDANSVTSVSTLDIIDSKAGQSALDKDPNTKFNTQHAR